MTRHISFTGESNKLEANITATCMSLNTFRSDGINGIKLIKIFNSYKISPFRHVL